jgi:hypothetical protein
LTTFQSTRRTVSLKKYLTSAMIIMLVAPLVFFCIPQSGAVSNSTPLTPHEVRVLVVSPANLYLKGGHYLIWLVTGST